VCRRIASGSHSIRVLCGASGGGRREVTGRVEDRAAVHTFPEATSTRKCIPMPGNQAWFTMAPAGQYLMTSWGMGLNQSGEWFGKPSYLGIWTAPQPWGRGTSLRRTRVDRPGRQGGPLLSAADCAEVDCEGMANLLAGLDRLSTCGKYYSFNARRSRWSLRSSELALCGGTAASGLSHRG